MKRNPVDYGETTLDEQYAPERRTVSTGRGHRIAVGGASSPVAIFIAWFIWKKWGTGMTEAEIITLSSAIGSLTTTLALCFQDLRTFLFMFVKRRRETDIKRKTRR